MDFTTVQPESNESDSFPFDSSDIIIAASVTITMCVFGTIANLITIVTVLLSRKLKSTFYFLMMSLSFSDLLSAWVSILVLYRLTWGFDVWHWPDIACKLLWSLNMSTSSVTSLHIVMFSLFRFVSVYWPHKFTSFTLKRTKKAVAVIWLVSLAVGFIPSLFWFGKAVRDRTNNSTFSQLPSCSLYKESISPLLIYTQIMYPTMFYAPFLMILVFSIAIAIKISLIRKNRAVIKGKTSQKTAKEKQRKRENQILVQLALIVGSFFVGYVPLTIAHFDSLINLSKSVDGSDKYNWLFAFLGYTLLRLSECLNPVFYNLSSRKMRNETKKTIRLIWRKLAPKRDTPRLQPTSENTANKSSNQTNL